MLTSVPSGPRAGMLIFVWHLLVVVFYGYPTHLSWVPLIFQPAQPKFVMGFILMFDLTNEESFHAVKGWYATFTCVVCL